MLYIVLILVLAALGLVVAALITADSLWAWISIGLSVLAGVLLVVDWLRRRSPGGVRAPAQEDEEDRGEPAEPVRTDPTEQAGESTVGPGSAETAQQSGAAEHSPAADLADATGTRTTEITAATDVAGQRGAGEDSAATDAAGEPARDEPARDEQNGSEQTHSEAATASGSTASGSSTAAGDTTAMLPASGALTDPDGEPAEEQTDAADVLVVSALDAEVLVVDEHPRYHLPRCDWLEARETIALPAKEARELGFTPCALCGPDATLAARYREERRSRK